MQLNFPAIDPAAQIRDYRNNYVNISSLVKQSKDAPTNLSLMTPGRQPILNLDLPAALRQAMADFQATRRPQSNASLARSIEESGGASTRRRTSAAAR